MGLKRTTVYLDEDVLFLASHQYGIKTGKLSELIRKCLECLVLSEEEIDRPDLVKSRAMAVATAMKNDLRAQKKIISEGEAVQAEATEYRQKRDRAIEEACLTIFLKHRDFGRYLPENDPDFLYVDTFNRTVSEISQISGYDVDNIEVIGMWHKKARTRQVGSRETGENVYGIKEEQ